MDFELLKQNMGELEEEAVLEFLNGISNAEDAQKAMEACQAGMEIVGQQFETGEFFVGDLVFAGELMQEAVTILKPYLAGENSKTIGKMVFCTVEGDLHDIGKNIVRSLLEAAGTVKVTAALSNVSYGMPVRKLVNVNFLALSMAAGLDSVIADPLNRDVIGTIYATEALLGRDRLCRKYNTAYRKGKIGPVKQ